MRWSKVRKLVEDSFADSVHGRVKVNVTNADPRGVAWQDTCKAGWLSVDGKVVAHVDPHGLRRLTLSLPTAFSQDDSQRIMLIVQPRSGQKVPSGAEVGTFLDFPEACWDYLHSNLNESLASSDPFISSLAVLNAKVGRQRLRRAATKALHPLTRALLDFRLAAERDHASAAKDSQVRGID